MRTGLTKRQKDTVIYFNEESDIIEVRTHNTDLKNRLMNTAKSISAEINSKKNIARN